MHDHPLNMISPHVPRSNANIHPRSYHMDEAAIWALAILGFNFFFKIIVSYVFFYGLFSLTL